MRYNTINKIRIEPYSPTYNIIKQYDRGKCYAGLVEKSVTPEQIQTVQKLKGIRLYAFNESSGMFLE